MHKNKTFASFLASVLGGFGMHRFYLYGKKDVGGWIHLLTVPLSLISIIAGGNRPILLLASLFALSVLSGFLEALIIGVTPDEKWDALHNADSGRHSISGWPLALLLVLTLGIGAIMAIAMLARTFDLLYTGGAYG
ncbi:MAG TPA: NINE protein [Burkholderiaceae bacterium]|nr:NINE protein [Burkholderiaceae bacterium]